LPIDTIFVSTNEDVSLDICLEATDPDGDNILVEDGESLSGNGTLDFNHVNPLCFTFLPDPDFIGQDTLRVAVCDQTVMSLCDTVIVVVNVLSVNDPPSITESGLPIDTVRFSTMEDTSLQACLTAFDPDGDIVSLVLAESVSDNGEYDVAPIGDMCFSFTPSKDFSGEEVGKLTVCDNQSPALCDDVVVIIDVIQENDPPVIIDQAFDPVDSLFFTTKEDFSLGICIDLVDPDFGPWEIVSATSKSGVGIVNLSIVNPLCYTFIPTPDINGTDISIIVVCDSGNPALCDTIVVVTEITPVNDPPSITEGGLPVDTVRFSTIEDIPIEACLAALDPDGDAVNLVLAESVSGNGAYNVVPAGDLCFSFTPNKDFSGEEVGKLTVCDNQSPALCDSVVVIIDIIQENDPPVILNQTFDPVDSLFFTTKEDFSLGICIDLVDPDFGPWKITSATSESGVATIDLSIANPLCYTFIPTPDINGTDILEIVVCDSGNPALCDSIIVVTEITPVNDPPIIMDNDETIMLNTEEDNVLNFCLTVTDADNDPLSGNDILSDSDNGVYTVDSGNALCYSFSPNENFFGQEIVSISVCDNGTPNLCDVASIIIEIVPVNDAPIVTDDEITVLRNRSFTGNLLENDSDIEGHTLSVNLPLEASPLHGELVIDEAGNFTYTPDQTYFGEDSFSYVVCDNGQPSLCSTGSVFITVEDIDLFVYQGFSPNGDGINDFWQIDGIDLFENNLVRLYDRYNNTVFEIFGYNNLDNVWQGESNRGVSKKDLPDGTYYYIINLGDGDSLISGFVVLKRE